MLCSKGLLHVQGSKFGLFIECSMKYYDEILKDSSVKYKNQHDKFNFIKIYFAYFKDFTSILIYHLIFTEWKKRIHLPGIGVDSLSSYFDSQLSVGVVF